MEKIEIYDEVKSRVRPMVIQITVTDIKEPYAICTFIDSAGLHKTDIPILLSDLTVIHKHSALA